MKVVYKVWIDNEGKAFGEGPYRLLRLVEKTGSLHKAALEMGMSYRKAFSVIQRAEERLGIVFLKRKIGGESGGGSTVTEKGRTFMEMYEAFVKDLDIAINSLYDKHFKNPSKNR
ncbi:MAG: LysR family transcriptional regulator [Syntrophorhabdaceae bacterium]|nr:LysR family transcriptional regulator [Syntrophorhabdales bacterium]MBP9560882.1 LysR family transcriptional regulator [Syntrophorhabdaceae bacterium]